MIVTADARLRSEIDIVQRMLAKLPEEAVIDRMSLESRIEDLKEELAQIPHWLPAAARLTFRGRPVVGTRGIFADFASKATSAFSELITVLAAAQSKPVAWTGPIPNREDSQVLITGTAIGSFGFELQEHVAQGMLPEFETPVALAFAQSRELLSSMVGDDDELTEAIAGLDERTVTNLRRFLDVLASSDAVCHFSFRDRDFGFRDVAQVRLGLNRLARENFHEEVETYFGVFLGVLPNRRTFEFRTAQEGNVVSGKIGNEITEPAVINAYLYKPVRIELTATRLGHGRAKYVLRTEPEWPIAS